MADLSTQDSLGAEVEQRLRTSLTGSYEVERVLGIGGSAVVFQALDVKHHRRVALKVLRPEIAAQIGSRRFLQEIEVASRLSHPHVLALYDSGEVDGILYYVMPLVDGVSLRERLRREGPLPLEDALRITRDVASALQHAHDHGVVHRDVKPENILLTRDGAASLADFGLAHVLAEVPATRLTAGGVAVGTVWYMSPEQGAGGSADPRADQYALACVLYEMLAGDPPFQGRTAQNVIARHRADPRPHVRTLRETVPDGVDAAIARGMAIHPADRFANASDFVRGLEAALTAETLASVLAPRRSPALSRSLHLWRSRVAAAAAGLAVIAAVFLVARALQDRPSAGHLDANRVAIAPFNLLGVGDTVWASGMVDLLVRNFDGAGPLRSVPASVVLRGWRGRADETSARALAARTGAGLVVFGSLEISGRDRIAGRDSVRLRATLIDAVSSRTVGLEFTTPADDASRVPILADTLASMMLAELSRTRPVTAVVGRSLGSTSLPALKAFLQAEQALRRNDYSEAGRWYSEAVSLDGNFAVAYRGLRTVRRAIADENDSLARWYGLRAGERNHGLAPRDSLLLVSDSLAGTAPLGFTYYTPADLARLRRRLATLGAVVARYPDDPDAWQELGEARVHSGYRAGIDQPTALSAFETAVRVDSGYAPAYWHAVELALSYRPRDSTRALIRRYLSLQPNDGRLRALDLLLSSSRSTNAEGWRLVSRLSADSAAVLGYTLRRWRESPATGLRVLTELLDDRRRGPSVSSERIRNSLMATLLQYGRLAEARDFMVQQGFELVPMNLVTYGRYGVVPRDSVTAVIRAWTGTSDIERLRSAAEWFGYTRDTTALKGLASRLTVPTPVLGVSANDSVALHYVAQATRAYLALAMADSTQAAALFASLPDSLCSWACWIEVETSAQLATAKGDPAFAARLLDRHPPPYAPVAFIELPWLTERVRTARRLRESDVIVRLTPSLASLSRGTDHSVAATLGLEIRQP
jgi:serine/threonine-protein kinase